MSSPWSSTYTSSRESSASLFNRTMLVLTGLDGLLYVGTQLTWGMQLSGAAFIGLFVVSLILVVVSGLMVKERSLIAIVPAAGFALCEGALLGPVLTAYSAELGSQTVALAVASTAGMTALCGLISSVVSFNYNKVESVLMWVLFGMIIFGVVRMFVNLPPEVDLTYSLFGMGVFTVFMLVDFLRLKDMNSRGVNGWGMATFIGLNILLDQVNFLLHMLRALAAAKADD